MISDNIKSMKDITKILLRILLLFIILFLVTRIFKKADEKIFLSPASSVFSKGNAPDSIRNVIISQLNRFQDGYYKRDISQIDSFMQSLYSKKTF
jgi:hypothetical protein